MKKHAKIPIRIKEIGEILKQHDIDFVHFLKQFRQYERKNRYKFSRNIKRTRVRQRPPTFDSKRMLHKSIKYFFRKNKYAYMVRTDIGSKFRIVCLNDAINATRLLEAFMNAFVEGDPSIIELMKDLGKYHEEKLFISTDSSMQRRLNRMKKIFIYYNLPLDWWKKYTDFKTDVLL